MSCYTQRFQVHSLRFGNDPTRDDGAELRAWRLAHHHQLITTIQREKIAVKLEHRMNEDSGASLVEYALLMALIAVVALVALHFLGGPLPSNNQRVNAQVCGITGNKVLLNGSVDGGGPFTDNSASKLVLMQAYSFTIDPNQDPQTIVSAKSLPAGARVKRC